MRLQEWYGDDLMVLPDLCAKVGGLLGDATPSVRQAASHTLVNLFKIFGDSLISELEDCGEHVVSVTQLKLIKQAIRAAETNGYPVVSLSVEGLDSNSNTHTPGANNTNHRMIGDEDDDDDDDFGLSRGVLTSGAIPTGHSSMSMPSPSSLEQPSSSSTRTVHATPTSHITTATATTMASTSRPSSSSSSSSSGRGTTPGTGTTTTTTSSTPSSGIAIGNNNSNNHVSSSTASDLALALAPATTPTSASAFHPSTYMTLLAEGTHPKIVRLVNLVSRNPP